MVPSNAILDRIAVLLADDTTTLAAVLALKVHLAIAPFTPSRDLDVTTLTEATITPTAGNQLEYVDPVTGLRTVELTPPIGGWHFQTTGTANLPQTVYGWYVTNNAGTILYGSGLV